MKVNKARVIWTLLAALIAAALGFAAFHWFEIVDTKRWIGASGEARDNPFYALEKTLDAMGARVEKISSSPDWDKALASAPPDGEGSLFIGDNRLARMTPARVAGLRAWVDGGGHLIIEAEKPGIDDPLLKSYEISRVRLRLVGGELVPRPRKTDPDAPPKTDEEAEEEVGEFGMDAADLPAEDGASKKPASAMKLPLARPNPVVQVQMPGEHVFKVAFAPYQNLTTAKKRPTDWWVADDIGLRLVQREAGRGRITVISGFDFFGGVALKKHDHAEFLWHLLVAKGNGVGDNRAKQTVWLALRDPGGGLWVWLKDYAWMVLAALALLLLAWLARIVPRFGTLLVAAAPARLSLAEHLVAMGRYLGNKHAFTPLAAAVRERFFARLARERPALARLSLGALVGELEKQSGLGEARIRRAIEAPPADRRAFFETVRTLRTLEQNLRAPARAK